jgi:hypothetical protein
VLDTRLASWRRDHARVAAASARFAPRVEYAPRLLALFHSTLATGKL